MTAITLHSRGPQETQALGRALGAALEAGQVIALIGPLGAGKTTLVKGLAAGAGVADLRRVNSPTFVLVNEYEAAQGGGGLRIHHVDAYRLRGGGDLEAIGFDEMLTQGAVVVEWADRVADLLPPDTLTIRLSPAEAEVRTLVCAAGGPGSGRLLAALSRWAGGKAG